MLNAIIGNSFENPKGLLRIIFLLLGLRFGEKTEKANKNYKS
jgi:hypothetical protein